MFCDVAAVLIFGGWGVEKKGEKSKEMCVRTMEE